MKPQIAPNIRPTLATETLTPQVIVTELEKYIIGQHKAKCAVAVALRNRWRRMQLNENMRQEVVPKNILMIGPTGVGKTEMAKRLAALTNAPFIKVEATKFTEIGYVGREVESIIKDLVEIAIHKAREREQALIAAEAHKETEKRIMKIIKKQYGEKSFVAELSSHELLKSLRNGDFDQLEVDIETHSKIGMEIVGPPGLEDMSNQLQEFLTHLADQKTSKHSLTVVKAMEKIHEEECGRLLNNEEIKTVAMRNVEQSAIVFIDEIDKIARPSDNYTIQSGDISREGVQRDLLPLIEGCTVNTRHGPINTDHILFVASGAFHTAKPSDLIPELQGRLPIRVELNALTPEDFKRILTEPNNSLILQYKELLGTEGVKLEFTEEAIQCMAEIAWSVNERNENIGARRLHTVMECLLEEISFKADTIGSTKEPVLFEIDKPYVEEKLRALSEDEDLSRFIL